MHHADARKNRLQKRFGHDALSEPLYTPMLHKNVQHLLPTMYVPSPRDCARTPFLPCAD